MRLVRLVWLERRLLVRWMGTVVQRERRLVLMLLRMVLMVLLLLLLLVVVVVVLVHHPVVRRANVGEGAVAAGVRRRRVYAVRHHLKV